MKHDPTGTRPRDSRHIYCNLYNPIICPVLTLFTYLLVTPPSTDTHLFPGSSQNNRYNKYLKNLLAKKREYMMRRFGINIDELGAQSAWKGASTYMISGCLGGPIQQAVNMRCGWRMVGVTDTYCKYKAAKISIALGLLEALLFFHLDLPFFLPYLSLDLIQKIRFWRS